jgi:crossover junction endodeoxyribonuclease RusA
MVGLPGVRSGGDEAASRRLSFELPAVLRAPDRVGTAPARAPGDAPRIARPRQKRAGPGGDSRGAERLSERIDARADFEPVTLILPYPVSANRYWRTYMPKGFKAPVTTVSAEAKAYKQAVRRIARSQGIVAPFPGRVAVRLRLYPECPLDWQKRAQRDPLGWDDTVRCIDLDNAVKVLFDALSGVVFCDDSWVRGIASERMEPDGKPARVEATIFRYAVGVSPQLDLFR